MSDPTASESTEEVFAQTARNRVRRLPKRGAYDRETIYSIVDEALICHVSFVQEGQPFVIPTIHGRIDDMLLLHGATTSRLLRHAQQGHPLCVAITLVDGLVLARSVFHHSMNYRAAILFGEGRLLDDETEKLRALEAISEHVLPGRWADARLPNANELAATSVIAMPIESASAKVRTGPPVDDEEDYTLPIWAGEIPMRQQVLPPQQDPRQEKNVPLPDYLAAYLRGQAE